MEPETSNRREHVKPKGWKVAGFCGSERHFFVISNECINVVENCIEYANIQGLPPAFLSLRQRGEPSLLETSALDKHHPERMDAEL